MKIKKKRKGQVRVINSEWISVEDRIPIEGGLCRVKTEDGELGWQTMLNTSIAGFGRLWRWDGVTTSRVTHWKATEGQEERLAALIGSVWKGMRSCEIEIGWDHRIIEQHAATNKWSLFSEGPPPGHSTEGVLQLISLFAPFNPGWTFDEEQVLAFFVDGSERSSIPVVMAIYFLNGPVLERRICGLPG